MLLLTNMSTNLASNLIIVKQKVTMCDRLEIWFFMSGVKVWLIDFLRVNLMM